MIDATSDLKDQMRGELLSRLYYTKLRIAAIKDSMAEVPALPEITRHYWQLTLEGLQITKREIEEELNYLS